MFAGDLQSLHGKTEELKISLGSLYTPASSESE